VIDEQLQRDEAAYSAWASATNRSEYSTWHAALATKEPTDGK
jgi:hypothetical protein